MGIPKFARFLITRYPLILKKIKESLDIPEIDNLYLDINSIIHNVSHNNDIISSCRQRNNRDIYYDVCCTIDRIIHMIKPKKMCLISADGVAPRAKMNQQRSRRFRKTDISDQDLALLKDQGLDISKMFNSDCISAGTEFMYNLSCYMKEFIEAKKKTDLSWSNINILLTGSDVPGEGEHKIIEYIRQYKAGNDYQINTKHCIYGLDADLIMLSLITHEANVCILREERIMSKKKSSDRSYKQTLTWVEPYELIMVSILREYLELEFLEWKPKLKFDFNIERVIDDFIFFCFFIGNDFLPNLNSMDIETGALDYIFSFYKQSWPDLDDYITYHGKIDFNRAKTIFALLAKQEIKSLEEMLMKIDNVCKDNKNKQQQIKNDKIKILKSKQIAVKKEEKLNELKQKSEGERIEYKLNKTRNKIQELRLKYATEVSKITPNKVYKFEDDVNNYIKDEMNKTIALLTAPKDTAPKIEKINEKIVNRTIVDLFQSDDEEKTNTNNDNYLPTLTRLLKEASKYQKYINDDHYCSDINIEDIDDSDISSPSNEDILKQVNHIEEETTKINTVIRNEDLNKVFQEKLLQYYIDDVNKAKHFYYMEKLHFDISTPEGKKEREKMFNKYLEGLQWVLFYYYRGIKSWRWYYPYHYAPMISDFEDIPYEENIDQLFENDTSKPFEPFQSLLFILPVTSFNLLPSCYREIPNDLKQLFPSTFDIDYNGKKTSWESITLIPFLDEEIMLQKEKEYRQWNEEEKKRDSWGESYWYCPNTWNDNITKQVYQIYQQSNALLEMNYITKNVDFTFPTLAALKYDFSFELVKQYFGKNITKKRRINICPIWNTTSLSYDDIEYFFNRREMFVNYPYKTPGKLVGIICNGAYYYFAKGQVHQEMNFRHEWSDIKQKISGDLYKQGITVSRPDILCNVALFKMFVRGNDGRVHKVYNEKQAFYYPLELTSLNVDTQENDFTKLSKKMIKEKKTFEDIKHEYAINEKCILLSSCFYGCVAYVSNYITPMEARYNKLNEWNYTNKYYDKNQNYDLEGNDWRMSLNELYSGPLIEVKIYGKDQAINTIDNQFGAQVINKNKEVYLSLNDTACKLNVSKWWLGLITSNLNIINCTNETELTETTKVVDYEHWNIGLNMKLKTQYGNLILPGYTRHYGGSSHDSSYYEFSSSAIDLISQYQKKFPWVFNNISKYLDNYKSSSKFFKWFQVFPDIDDIDAKLSEVAVWINSWPINDIMFSNNHSDYLSQRDCNEFSNYVETKWTSKQGKDYVQTIIWNPGYIYQENDPWIPIYTPFEPSTWFNWGDRVVNLRTNDKVFIPFGLRGTVTGINNDYIEVMFDSEFLGGSTCQGRFKQKKGAYVNCNSLLNLTTKSPVYLRRNTNKYPYWNFVRTRTNYDTITKNYGFSSDNMTNNSNNFHNYNYNLKKTYSDNVGNNENNFSTSLSRFPSEQSNFYNNNSQTVLQEIGTGSVNNQLNINSQPYKKIIKRGNEGELGKENKKYLPQKIVGTNIKVDSQFKTYPEGIIISTNWNKISYDNNTVNQSEYRENRHFQNETIGAYQMYYYSCKDVINENWRKNENIIFKQLK